jgi:hypothetical protein
MTRAAVLGLVLTALLALAGTASAADYGRWRVTLSGHLTDQWQSPATTACAITGGGATDLTFKSSKPLTVRLRRVRITRKLLLWRVSDRNEIRLAVKGTVTGQAQRQPPASPDGTCSWPDPANWSCGPLAYTARQQLLSAGSAGLGVDDTHHFDFPPRVHEPDGRQCGPGADADLPLDGPPAHGHQNVFFRLRPKQAAARHRIVLREHADGSWKNVFDEQPPFDVNFSRTRDTKIVLVPVR